ncbi:Clathrin/coatomer adaptor adaptin-like N-terminal [Trinorchestia longiramus]|nr:Clathrin/coatomer adaptor adaptin-like N-terminal [Trinorchestia longiramus]
MKCEKVKANECIILVVCYMITTGPLAQEGNVKKYTTLERVVQEFCRFPVIVMGDMSGHVGILGKKVYENGHKLIDFFEENEFKNLNVTKGKAAIEYALVNHEARQHVREMYVDGNIILILITKCLFLSTIGVEKRDCSLILRIPAAHKMELPCYTLLQGPSDTELPSEMQLRQNLEHGDVKVKIDALKKTIQLILSGEKLPGILMTVIRFVMPLEDHTIKKLLLVFWEIVPKTTPEGKLLQEMILICDAYRKVSSHR